MSEGKSESSAKVTVVGGKKFSNLDMKTLTGSGGSGGSAAPQSGLCQFVTSFGQGFFFGPLRT